MPPTIGRYLRSEPVTAHPPSIAYRTHKFLRRNKLGVTIAAVVVLIIAMLVIWWHMPPAVPLVESMMQLTDNGQPKSWMVSDDSRIYFTERLYGSRRIVQVPVTGGLVTPVHTDLTKFDLAGIARDGSGLLVTVRNLSFDDQPWWWVPLPAGEPRRIADLNAAAADALPGEAQTSLKVPGNEVSSRGFEPSLLAMNHSILLSVSLVSAPTVVLPKTMRPS